MAAPKRGLADLSDQDRLELEAWLVEFDQRWDAGLLPDKARRIPSSGSWRLPALREMVKIDLERQWERGNRLSLESYLKEYPELGNPADVSADLIQAEYEVRKQFGATVDLDEYARRFPAQVEELRRLVASGRSSLSFRSKSRSGLQKTGERNRGHADTVQELPEQFGRYRIIRRLGAGGMGSVYLAEDTRLKRKVALKVAHIGGSESRQVLERFYREAEAAAGLDHPSLCKVYDVDEIENVHYLTMEYIEGTTLADFVADRKDRSQRQVAAIVGKLALALQEAHAKGVVHRDLKPANVMIRQTGQKAPVIVDFGLAQQLNAGGMRLTQTGQAMGTPYYMAIEQVKGDLDSIGPACDIYALGVMLYELLTGEVPFDGPNPMVVIAQILTTRAAPPSSLRPDLDPRLEAICLKAMAREIKDRYSSMAEFAAALTGYLKAPATAASDPTPGAVSAVTGERTSRTQGSDTLMRQFLANRELPHVPEPETQGEAKGPRSRWPMIAGLAAAVAAVVLGVVIYVVTDKGRIKIQVDGPTVAVKVDGDVVEIDDLDEPITLRTGDHELTVIRGNTETQTRKFVVHRGANEAQRFEYEPKRARTENVGTAGSPAVLSPKAGFQPLINGKNLTNSIGMTLVRIEPGTFTMGSNEGDSDEQPSHPVRITRPFSLGIHEVTQGQYRAVTGQSPSENQGSDDLPVERVSWLDVVAFCNALSIRENLTPYYRIDGRSVTIAGGNGYRLPTEAEWEYACRAGTTTRYSFGDDASRVGEFAWIGLNSGGRSHPVGEKPPNAFGLYDMHGNVFEWCWDAFDSGYYRQSPPDDPAGPVTGLNRAHRGGGFTHAPSDASSAHRAPGLQDFRNLALGFRIARDLPKSDLAASGTKPTPVDETVDTKAMPDVSVPPDPNAQGRPKTMTNLIGMKLTLIPAGEFQMGSSKDEDQDAPDAELPRHRVRITRPFYMGATEVTQGQYRAVTGLSPSHFKGAGVLPVEQVSWRDAIVFCNELSRKASLPPFYNVQGDQVEVRDWKGAGYRLPTEAEREYACRAGSTTRFSFGKDATDLARYAWFNENSNWTTHPVGLKSPNAYGLFDMQGNVWEWCWDGFDPLYYRQSPVDDPTGPSNATHRVDRGGSWRDISFDDRSASRFRLTPEFKINNLGFRVALGTSEQIQAIRNPDGSVPKPQNKEADVKPEATARSSPAFSLKAESLLGGARLLEKSRKLNSAIKAYAHIIEDYPGTQQALKAQARINVIRGK